MKVRYLTIAQIEKAAKKHKYLALRFKSGHIMGVNSRCVINAVIRTKKHKNCKTNFVSYKVLNFNEYINCKHSFV